MINGRDFSEIVDAARTHYENLKTDINNAKDRIEHIRLTSLAQEAHNLLTDLLVFEVGLVYSHVSTGEMGPKITTFNEEPDDIEPLDLPEFRSPYKPPMQ